MNIQPSVIAAGMAGTARAQQRGSDSETVKNQQSAVNQSESPGKGEGADNLTLEASGKSSDRDADGRRQFEAGPEPEDQASDSQDVSVSHRNSIELDEDYGDELDLKA